MSDGSSTGSGGGALHPQAHQSRANRLASVRLSCGLPSTDRRLVIVNYRGTDHRLRTLEPGGAHGDPRDKPLGTFAKLTDGCPNVRTSEQPGTAVRAVGAARRSALLERRQGGLGVPGAPGWHGHADSGILTVDVQ